MSTATLIHGYRPGTLRETRNCDWCLIEPRFRGSTLCADHELDYRVNLDPTLKSCSFPLNSPLRGYRLGCRCESRCKATQRAHDKAMREQKRSNLTHGPDCARPANSPATAFNKHGCRCDARCKPWYAEQLRKRRGNYRRPRG